MNEKPHGISVGLEKDKHEFILLMKATGKLTHEDYRQITPVIDSAITAIKDPKVKVFVDGSELEGWDVSAAWDDFELGLKHGNEFDKIAIYGSQKWLQQSANIGSWFTSGQIKFFENKDKAMNWLH